MTQNTRGLVQEFHHQILPDIRPSATFIITGLAMLPCFLKIILNRQDKLANKVDFIQGIVICAATSFMFGWHVHEKAILMVFIPIRLDNLNIFKLSLSSNKNCFFFFF